MVFSFLAMLDSSLILFFVAPALPPTILKSLRAFAQGGRGLRKKSPGIFCAN